MKGKKVKGEKGFIRSCSVGTVYGAATYGQLLGDIWATYGRLMGDLWATYG